MEPINVTPNRIPTFPAIAVATAKLIAALKDGKPGDSITAERLAAVCGKHVRPQHPGYGNLRTAREIVRREHGLIWQWRSKEARIECLGADGILDLVHRGAHTIHVRIRNELKNIAVIDDTKLPDGRRAEAVAVTVQLGSMLEWIAPKTRKKLVERKISGPLDLPKLLDAFVTKAPARD